MHGKQLAIVLGGLVAILALPGCSLDIPDLNNPGLEQLENNPTTALATVSAPEAAIDVSATRSFWSCIDPPSGGARLRDLGGRLAHRLVILADQPRAQLGGCRHILDAAHPLAG